MTYVEVVIRRTGDPEPLIRRVVAVNGPDPETPTEAYALLGQVLQEQARWVMSEALNHLGTLDVRARYAKRYPDAPADQEAPDAA